jgi:hypothetical protein
MTNLKDLQEDDNEESPKAINNRQQLDDEMSFDD